MDGCHTYRRDSPSGLFVVGLLVSAVLCFLSGDGRAVLAGLIALTLAGLYLSGAANSWRKLGQRPAYTMEPTTFVFTDEAITIESVASSVRLRWAAVTRAVERPYALLFFTHPLSYRDVPRSALTPTQEAQLRAYLVGRGLLSGVLTRPDPSTRGD